MLAHTTLLPSAILACLTGVSGLVVNIGQWALPDFSAVGQSTSELQLFINLALLVFQKKNNWYTKVYNTYICLDICYIPLCTSWFFIPIKLFIQISAQLGKALLSYSCSSIWLNLFSMAPAWYFLLRVESTRPY